MPQKDLRHRTCLASASEKRQVSKHIMRTKSKELLGKSWKADIYKGNPFCRDVRMSIGRKERSRKDNNEVKSVHRCMNSNNHLR